MEAHIAADEVKLVVQVVIDLLICDVVDEACVAVVGCPGVRHVVILFQVWSL